MCTSAEVHKYNLGMQNERYIYIYISLEEEEETTHPTLCHVTLWGGWVSRLSFRKWSNCNLFVLTLFWWTPYSFLSPMDDYVSISISLSLSPLKSWHKKNIHLFLCFTINPSLSLSLSSPLPPCQSQERNSNSNQKRQKNKN